MNEDLREQTWENLVSRYDEDRVVWEPKLPNTSARPDFGVQATNGDGYLLLVTCSSMRTRHRRREDIASLKRMMDAADIEFGALISTEVEYVFELTEFEGKQVEREIPTFPESQESDFENVLSAPEVGFRLWNAIDHIRGDVSKHEYHYHLFHALFRKFIANQTGAKADIYEIDEQWIDEMDKQIADHYPSYTPNVAPKNVELQRRILQSFEGVDLGVMQPRAAKAFIQLLESSRMASESMTPPRVADALVDLANPSEGDELLDPAAGIGNVARGAAQRGTNVSAVEVNAKTTNSAVFLNAVHDVDIEYLVANFLDATFEESSSLPSDLDHVIVDPPFGLHYERPDGTRERNAEELFVLESLKRIRPGGTITAVLSQGSLFKQRSAEFRETITDDYRLTTIIQIDEPVFQHTAVPTAIVQIVKEPAEDEDEIQYQIVSDSDAEDELDRAVEAIRSGDAPTLRLSDLQNGSFLPGEIVGMQRIINRLRERYDHLVELKERANDIRTGLNSPETVSESGPDSIPLLRPLDVSEDGPEEYVLAEEASVTAGPGDVLVSVKGSTSVVHAPKMEVVPSGNWAILRFGSDEEALVYATFLESEFAQDQLERMRSGATIPYISIRRLGELLVPTYKEDQIIEKADRIRSLQNKVDKHERQRAALEDDLRDIV